MIEILTIENFGPIKHISLQLKEINIFIGDQGTGKSTLAKILMAIQNTVFREISTLDWINKKLDTTTESFIEYLKFNGIDTYLSATTKIYYESEYTKFTFMDNKIDSTLKPKKLNERSIGYDFTYIPAERILVSTLANALYSLMLNDVSLPKLFLKFGEKFQKGREQKAVFNFKKVLDVDYKYANDRDIVILSSGKEILMEHASSGIQSSIPLLIVFDSVLQNSKYKNLLVIEEPELSCFPETQNKLIKHLVEVIDGFSNNRNESKKQLLLTTHSPYILTSLNNLMSAFMAGQKDKAGTNEIIDSTFWLNPDDVSVYMMLPEGGCEDIMDRQEGLIKAEKIDGVSELLNHQFDELLRIDLGLKKEV